MNGLYYLKVWKLILEFTQMVQQLGINIWTVDIHFQSTLYYYLIRRERFVLMIWMKKSCPLPCSLIISCLLNRYYRVVVYKLADSGAEKKNGCAFIANNCFQATKKLIEGQLKTSQMYFFYSFLGHVIEETHRTAVELKMEQDCNLK